MLLFKIAWKVVIFSRNAPTLQYIIIVVARAVMVLPPCQAFIIHFLYQNNLSGRRGRRYCFCCFSVRVPPENRSKLPVNRGTLTSQIHVHCLCLHSSSNGATTHKNHRLNKYPVPVLFPHSSSWHSQRYDNLLELEREIDVSQEFGSWFRNRPSDLHNSKCMFEVHYNIGKPCCYRNRNDRWLRRIRGGGSPVNSGLPCP